MSEEKKDNRPTKNQLKLEKQFKVCKCGYNCWKRDGFSCCVLVIVATSEVILYLVGSFR
jgi:hypothetical protein